MTGGRSLCWRLNWYRQSELEGALLLGRLARHVDDPYLVHQLTKHCADEARHAWLWQRTLTGLFLPAVPSCFGCFRPPTWHAWLPRRKALAENASDPMLSFTIWYLT